MKSTVTNIFTAIKVNDKSMEGNHYKTITDSQTVAGANVSYSKTKGHNEKESLNE